MADEWAYWRAMLKWRSDPNAKFPQPDYDPKRPETGTYRMKQSAVAIWRVDGGVQCLVTSKDGWKLYNREDQIGDSVFSYCCRAPISREAYDAFIATKRWPDDIEPPKRGSATFESGREEIGFVPPKDGEPGNGGRTESNESATVVDNQSRTDSAIARMPGVGDNLPKAPEKALAAELDDLIERAAAWWKSIGETVHDAEEANKLANYKIAVTELEKRIVAAEEAEKRPYLDTTKAITAKWSAVVSKANRAKKRLADLLLPWLSAQRDIADRAAREAREARAKEEAERRAAIQAGMTPPPPPPLARAAPSATVAGTQGRVSIRTTTRYEVSDLKAASAYLAGLENPPPDFVEAVRKAGGALMKAGVGVPGMVARTEDAVA